MFSVGAAAAMAAVLAPAVVQAAPALTLVPAPVVAPSVPAWLIEYPELGELMERFACALHQLNDDDPAHWVRMLAAPVCVAEQYAGLREPLPHPVEQPHAAAAPTSTLSKLIDDRLIVTIRMERLAPNARRRVRRWVARLPAGPDQPRVRYRLGHRNATSNERQYDFLHVATPRWEERSPFAYGQEVAEGVQRLLGPITCTVVCTHDGWQEVGALNACIAVDQTGALIS
jgi:hypothetical protein